jgi:tRNA 5-methylaminomethyl-2-thiouridine biosynthesis bifunctional protein
LCNALVKNIDKASLTVENIIQKDNLWSIGKYMAKKVILTTGYEDNLLDIRYMGLRGTWGSRGDFKSSLKIPISIHKSISISANLNGTIKIGATHNKAKDPCLLCKNPRIL